MGELLLPLLRGAKTLAGHCWSVDNWMELNFRVKECREVSFPMAYHSPDLEHGPGRGD